MHVITVSVTEEKWQALRGRFDDSIAYKAFNWTEEIEVGHKIILNNAYIPGLSLLGVIDRTDDLPVVDGSLKAFSIVFNEMYDIDFKGVPGDSNLTTVTTRVW